MLLGQAVAPSPRNNRVLQEEVAGRPEKRVRRNIPGGGGGTVVETELSMPLTAAPAGSPGAAASSQERRAMIRGCHVHVREVIRREKEGRAGESRSTSQMGFLPCDLESESDFVNGIFTMRGLFGLGADYMGLTTKLVDQRFNRGNTHGLDIDHLVKILDRPGDVGTA